MAKTAPSIAALMEKGYGVLVKRGPVWTYPGAPNDRNGTNLTLPVKSVTDVEVQAALASGDLVVRGTDVMGVTNAVAAKPEDGILVRVINPIHAGSVEVATELPPNSRPTHDAGKSDRVVDVAALQPGADAAKSKPSGPIAGPSAVAAQTK